MFQRRPRRFRRHINGRSRPSRHNDNVQRRLGVNTYSNGQVRNNFRGNTQSAEKLFEKYNTLAKEALTSGDKTLSENYYQHADHFMRIIEDKNRNKNNNKVQDNEKSITDNKVQDNEKSITDNKELSTNSILNQEKIIKEK